MSPPAPVWAPQPGPQAALVACQAPLVFFGGARGGGKTDGVLGKWALEGLMYGDLFSALAFRRTAVSFEDTVRRAIQIFKPLGYNMSMAGNRPTLKHPNGANISFRFLDRVEDADEYQGRNVSRLWGEEVGQYPSPQPIDRLFGVMRSAGGVSTQMILTGNPGGPGQGWISDRFQLIPFPTRPRLFDVQINEGKVRCAVIPSRLTDNRILMNNDPQYIERLRMTGGKALVQAWLEGDWSAIEGAFFDTWDPARHIVRRFDVPETWLTFRSFDWGYAKPFSVGWWAVVGDEAHGLPKGCLLRVAEWYGASRPDEGLRMEAEAVAEGILERERSMGLESVYGVADPAIFAQDGGPSIAERMARVGCWWRRGDNKRLARAGAMGGWDQMRARLRGNDDGPMLAVFDGCGAFIRTIPAMQHDFDRPEDLDTQGEDHVADEARYACMSRPYVPPAPERAAPPPPVGSVYLPGPPVEHERRRVI